MCGASGFKHTEFAYRALSPTLNKEVIFRSLDDIFEEVFRCFHGIKDSVDYTIGQNIWVDLSFYCNPILFFDADVRDLIDKTIYCIEWKFPPFASYDVADIKELEMMTIIKNEYHAAIQYMRNKAEKANASK